MTLTDNGQRKKMGLPQSLFFGIDEMLLGAFKENAII
jgi:hypothetical protein